MSLTIKVMKVNDSYFLGTIQNQANPDPLLFKIVLSVVFLALIIFAIYTVKREYEYRKQKLEIFRRFTTVLENLEKLLKEGRK